MWVCTRWASLSRARACDAGIARSLILKLFRRGLPLLAVGRRSSEYFLSAPYRGAIPLAEIAGDRGRSREIAPTLPSFSVHVGLVS